MADELLLVLAAVIGAIVGFGLLMDGVFLFGITIFACSYLLLLYAQAIHI